jgi:hypothetical protein
MTVDRVQRSLDLHDDEGLSPRAARQLQKLRARRHAVKTTESDSFALESAPSQRTWY